MIKIVAQAFNLKPHKGEIERLIVRDEARELFFELIPVVGPELAYMLACFWYYRELDPWEGGSSPVGTICTKCGMMNFCKEDCDG